MAGAVSAGAYTAGVLDFLTEALDEWCAAKTRGEAVPGHDISIEVISGASAGGMCAAISAVMLQEDFEHIHVDDIERTGTSNRFYESWVNKIDIRELLKTDDLKQSADVVSLLDSTIITEIAEFAITLGTANKRSYVSSDLTLFLSLTNLRGTPYSLNGGAIGSIEETTFYFGDRIRFEMLHPGKTVPKSADAYPLDFSKPGTAGGWDLLKTSAMATGAVPIALAPRILDRRLTDYSLPVWESIRKKNALPPPNFPAGTPQPLPTLNVDGGTINNDPFTYSRDYLADLAPVIPDSAAPSGPDESDRAVIVIAPFPTTEEFQTKYDAKANSKIFLVLMRLFSALISQARFFGESLVEIMNGTTFNRFVIAPSDDKNPIALQCASLGAFGGFLDRGFRAHDYLLGRRNCQQFLKAHFVLPASNVVMREALDSLDSVTRASIIEKFKCPPPGTYSGAQQQHLTESEIWLPIIPLCTPLVSNPLPEVERHQMKSKDLDQVISLMKSRFATVAGKLSSAISSPLLRFFLFPGIKFVIPWLATKPVKDALIEALGDSYNPN
jgi:hypothetical protein